MKIYKAKDYADMSSRAANIISEMMARGEEVPLGQVR